MSNEIFSVIIAGMKQFTDNEYFPQNYKYSRDAFLYSLDRLQTEKKIGQIGQIGQWPIPAKKDQDLFVDHVWFPPFEKTENLFVLTSGIHGSETYAGAAVQAMFINEILPKVDRRTTGIFIVHAMNPFGFKYHQRNTETGVNLNRNFSVSGENYKKCNQAAVSLCERFLERKPVRSLKSTLLDKMVMNEGQVFFDGVSLDELVKGFSPGQFESAETWEFGGHNLEPQSQLLIAKLRELMPPFKNIIAFDLHTGLGESKRLHLLTDEPGKTMDKTLFAEIIYPEQDKKFYEFTPPETEGFYEVYGALNSAFGDLAAAHQRVCALTMEFGTLGHSLKAQVAGLNSFVLDHQGRYYGFANREIEQQVAQENFARSRPLDKSWETEVIRASRKFFLNVFARMGALYD